MKSLIGILSVGALMLFIPTAHAQTPDYIFSSYECFPFSCVSQVGPTFIGVAKADFQGTCTGGAIAGIEANIQSIIGFNPQTGEPQACSSLYTARASFEIVRTEQLDDFCEPYLLDEVRSIAEIWDIVSFPVWHKELSSGCDGSNTGITSFGTKPC